MDTLGTVLERVVMTRTKETRYKPMGRFKSAGGNSQTTKKHKKNPSKVKPTQQRIMVLKAPKGSTNLKITWAWRAI